MECLSNQPQPLSLSQLATEMGRSVSEIQRMVNVLHSSDYLIRNPQAGYSLSSKLYRMALRYPPYRDLEILLRPAMYEFVEETQESVHLSILQEKRMMVIAQVESPKTARISLQIGELQDPVETVSGRILLAGLPEEERAILLKNTDHTKKKIAWLNERLKRIHELGYEHMESSLYSGLYDLGVPIKNSDGEVLGALTTSWLAPKTAIKTNAQNTIEQKLLQALLRALTNCAI